MSERVDLTGCRFGHLVVLEEGDRVHGKRAWVCRCDCGGSALVRTNYLNAGKTVSCGCKRRKPLEGKTFNSLTVIRNARSTVKHRYLLCRCVCGKEVEARSDRLTSGIQKSCGCHRPPPKPKAPKTNRKAGVRVADHPLYGIWSAMKARCYNRNARAFSNYGDRGIRVCPEWRNDFFQFVADMGPKPSSKHSMDRIDNNGDYTPENCRWATPTQQARNNRGNRLITHGGETRCLAAWAEHAGVKLSTLWDRLAAGWSFADAVTRPVKGQ